MPQTKKKKKASKKAPKPQWRVPPFTQIAASNDDLYGLDPEGRVWIWRPIGWTLVHNIDSGDETTIEKGAAR